ncbi:MAG TPA: hypothetical protein VKA44_02475, partial [Gemmatimonadota bacterium]|nr:hypothetical protein [Gemmatimonadota bacterium]
MRTSVPIVALLASLLLPVAACGGSGETYLRFQADGRSFREEGVGQYVEPVSGHPGRFAVSIDPDDLERKPRASVSFHQFMDGPSAIGGRTVDLSEAPDDMAPALAVFDL